MEKNIDNLLCVIEGNSVDMMETVISIFQIDPSKEAQVAEALRELVHSLVGGIKSNMDVITEFRMRYK
jgi:hypothetical protein